MDEIFLSGSMINLSTKDMVISVHSEYARVIQEFDYMLRVERNYRRVQRNTMLGLDCRRGRK